MEFILIKNKEIEIATYVEGDGPLIVLVHGWPESWFSWRHQIPFLTSLGFKVAAISQRGYGKSSKPHNIDQYTILKLSSDIEAVIKGLGYKKAILIGHDWGAPIVWTTSIIYPESVIAVAGLSVPYWSVGEQSQLDLWKTIYKDKYFYQLYFLNEGIAEKELEADMQKTIELGYFSSDSRGMKFLLENQNNVKYKKNKNSGFLDNLPKFDSYPDWITKKEISFYVDEFKASGMRGPLNRYRAQDIDFKELSKIGPKKISHPSCFITGDMDPVNFMLSGSGAGAFSIPSNINIKESFQLLFERHYEDLRVLEILENVGHWTQEESPDQVNILLEKFLNSIS